MAYTYTVEIWDDEDDTSHCETGKRDSAIACKRAILQFTNRVHMKASRELRDSLRDLDGQLLALEKMFFRGYAGRKFSSRDGVAIAFVEESN